MTDTDLLIQNLRRENEALRAELEWTGKEIELARRSSGASMHKCGSDWAYCDGQCTRCFKGTIWISFWNIAFAVMGWHPLKPNCTDEEFEELFKWLGFEIEEKSDG